MASIKVAAVQMRARLGAVETNLAAAQGLVEEGFRHGAEWVVLPEFFTSGVAFAPAMRDAWLPLDGPALALLRRLARRHGGVVGGSFLARDGGDCFNAFCLVCPDGSYQRHDKDIPTLWEHGYYVGGSDDGVLAAPIGPVGAALCWELIRTQTARRLRGRVSLLLAGSCWWDFPLPVQARYRDEQQRLVDMLRDAPAAMARMLGVPVVHAAHAGEFEGLVPGPAARLYRSRYLGQTQIVSARGEVLARLDGGDEGVIVAEVDPAAIPRPSQEIPDGFWTATPPDVTLAQLEPMRALGQAHYASVTRPGLASR